MTALLDLLPLIAFFIASKKFGLLAGAAAVLAATLIVYGIHLMRQKWRLTKQQWVVLVLTILFCGATVLLRDDLYLRWKTPIINLSGTSATVTPPQLAAQEDSATTAPTPTNGNSTTSKTPAAATPANSRSNERSRSR